MIALEKCENTLDFLMDNDLLNKKEWLSCLFQVIISLATFQKVFSFTHNDLHTNNIMFVNTENNLFIIHLIILHIKYLHTVKYTN